MLQFIKNKLKLTYIHKQRLHSNHEDIYKYYALTHAINTVNTTGVKIYPEIVVEYETQRTQV